MKCNKKYILRKCLPFLCVPIVLSSCASKSSEDVLPPLDDSETLLEEVQVRYETIGDLPEYYKVQLNKEYDDLDRLDELLDISINVSNSEDLSWLSSCINLLNLRVNLVENVDKNKLDVIGDLKKLHSLVISCVNDYCYETKEEYEEALAIFNSDPRFRMAVSAMETDNGYYLSVVNDVSLNDISFDFLEELPNLVTLNLVDFRYTQGIDFSWLTKTSSLRALTLDFSYYKYLDLSPVLDVLPNLNLKDLTIHTNSCYITQEEIDFINKVTSVMDYNSFSFMGYNANSFRYKSKDDGYTLSVGFYDRIDFKSFKNLTCVDFSQIGIYNAATYLTQEDLEYFKNNNIEVFVGDAHTLEELEYIVILFDGITSSLKIDGLSDKEQLDVVLQYIIENYSYDEDSKENGTDYYYGGASSYLYGALQGDKIICGNYAALLNALLYRLGLESYYIVSLNHAWNLVRVDDCFYYVDSCWIDDEDNSFLYSTNYQEDYKWYMANPYLASKIDDTGSHISRYFPSWIDLDGGARVRKNRAY